MKTTFSPIQSGFSAPIKYESGNPEFRKLIEDKLSRQRLMHHLGLELTKIEDGYMEAQAPVTSFLQQQDGLIHGGAIATIADIVTGFAAFSLVAPRDRVVTSDLKISFFTPGRGEILFARGWVIKSGYRLQYCEGEAYAVHGSEFTLIAKAFAIMATIHGKEKED